MVRSHFVDYDGDGELDLDRHLRLHRRGRCILTHLDRRQCANRGDNGLDNSGWFHDQCGRYGLGYIVLSGVTLKAPNGSTVVTPTTTVAYDLMETNGLTEAQVATALGLDGISILSFLTPMHRVWMRMMR